MSALPEVSNMLFDFLVRTVAAAAPHRTFFTTISAITAGMIAGGALWLSRDPLPRERWIRYFGIAFAIFFVQYLLPSAVGIWQLFHNQSPQIPPALTWITPVASSANNILFLAAAFALMRWELPLDRLAFWLTAACVALIAIAIDGFEAWGLASRIPDGLFSAVCLGFLGYAMFSNVSPRRKLGLAAVALVAGLLYAGLNLLYALNPLLTEGVLWPPFRSALEDRLTHVTQNEWTAQQAVDTFLIGLALLAKLLLGYAGFILIVRALSMLSPKTLETSLHHPQAGTDFFLAERILPAIGQRFNADRVALCFRMPGLAPEQLAWWTWEKEKEAAERRLGRAASHYPSGELHPNRRNAQLTPLPAPGECPEREVLDSGALYERTRLRRKNGFGEKLAGDPESKLVVPVIHYGNYIGCLSADWHSRFAFTPTAVQQLETLANTLAPAVDMRRLLAAMHHWASQLQTLDFETMAGGYQGVASKLASLVYQTLAPLSAGVNFTLGFRPVWAVTGERGEASGEMTGLRMLDRAGVLRTLAGADCSVMRTLLDVKPGFKVGLLTLAWPRVGSHQNRPLIFPGNLLRRTLSSLIAGTVIDAAHFGLTSVLNDLQIAVNELDAAEGSREGWFSAIESATLKAGVVWAVARHPVPGDIQGSETLVAALNEISSSPLGVTGPFPFLVPLSKPLAGAAKLLVLYLPKTGSQIWLGVANPAFKHEIREALPWRIFLDRLTEAADSALARISSRQEVIRLESESARFRTLATASSSYLTFIHDMKNLARNFTATANSLEEALDFGLFSAPPDIQDDIARLADSAQELHEVSDTLLRSLRDDHLLASVPLLEPVHEIERLVRHFTDRRGIRLEVAVDPKLQVKVPFHVAYHAVLGLVSNSIDALVKGGEIRIEAEDQEEEIVCRVIDNGPGIRPSIRERLFHDGTTTKGTGGKGLFLIHILLDSQKAVVRCLSSEEGRTVFAITFPKSPSQGSEL